MRAFSHYLVTRINLGYLEGKDSQNDNRTEWLEFRLDLFFKVLVPSVLNQSNKNFKWLVYFDVKTPEYFRSKINSVLGQWRFISIFFKKGGFGDLALHLNEDLKLLLDPSVEFLITTRVDSDDMIHKDFVNEIQNIFSEQYFASVNYNFGLVYDVNSGVLARVTNFSNPFISLIEKVDGAGFKTVYYQEHSKYINQDTHIQVHNKLPLWCMTIHGANYSTKYYGMPYLFKNIHLKDDFNFRFQKRAIYSFRVAFLRLYLIKMIRKIWPYIIRRVKFI